MSSNGLERFVKAQEHDYGRALQEIKNGRKESHWMWYIFPQLQGLGHSPTAQYYAIKDREEAERYIKHPLLGSRLLEISAELLKLKTDDAARVLGWPDDMKLKSCMTLFDAVASVPIFGQVLDKFFGGERDAYTLDFFQKEKIKQDSEMRYSSPRSYEIKEKAEVIREQLARYHTLGDKGEYTMEDYYALPDDIRVELIDGQFFEMNAPSLIHQAVSMELSYHIKSFIRKKRGSCVVFVSPIDVQLDEDDRTMVQPDVVIVCDRKKLNKKCIKGAPDLVVEILSPSTKEKDMFLKQTKYKNAGVQEYWIIDTEKKHIITYYFGEADIPVIYGMDAAVPVKIFRGELIIDFSEVEEVIRAMEEEDTEE